METPHLGRPSANPDDQRTIPAHYRQSIPSIIVACAPREDILKGTFNPEVFAASLSQVMDHYRGKPGIIDNLYTDPDKFFQQAT